MLIFTGGELGREIIAASTAPRILMGSTYEFVIVKL